MASSENVLSAPIEDYHLCNRKTLLEVILPFLAATEPMGKRIVVHCSGGKGRTGHVLAAWLVYGRGVSPDEALATVIKMCRNPWEAVQCGNATEKELFDLLAACERSRNR